MKSGLDKLTTTDWAILACLVEEAGHGFKLASAFSGSGELAFLWRIARTQVYRAIESLSEIGLIQEVRQEEGEAGPSRTVYAATPEGQQAALAWMNTPVQHLRDGRSDLLLKLVFLQRRGLETQPLLIAQKQVFEQIGTSYRRQLEQASPAKWVPLQWRIAATQAAISFIDDQIAGANKP